MSKSRSRSPRRPGIYAAGPSNSRQAAVTEFRQDLWQTMAPAAVMQGAAGLMTKRAAKVSNLLEKVNELSKMVEQTMTDAEREQRQGKEQLYFSTGWRQQMVDQGHYSKTLNLNVAYWEWHHNTARMNRNFYRNLLLNLTETSQIIARQVGVADRDAGQMTEVLRGVCEMADPAMEMVNDLASSAAAAAERRLRDGSSTSPPPPPPPG